MFVQGATGDVELPSVSARDLEERGLFDSIKNKVQKALQGPCKAPGVAADV